MRQGSPLAAEVLSADQPPSAGGKRRVLRYVIGICAALAIVQGLRLYSSASVDVSLVYRAPKGELEVTLRDAAGGRLRRSTFATGARAHSLTLPQGDYTAELLLSGQTPVHRSFRVVDEGTIEIDWFDGRRRSD